MKTGGIDVEFSRHLKKTMDALELAVGEKENWPALRKFILTAVNDLHRNVIEQVRDGIDSPRIKIREGIGNDKY